MAEILCMLVLLITVLYPTPVWMKEASERIPFVASLMYQEKHYCSGAILNEKWIATAAQCLNTPKLEELKVVVGTNDLDAPGQTLTVNSTEIYPREEDIVGYTYNLALLKLNEDIVFNSNIQPVNLPEENAKAGEEAIIYGWKIEEDIAPRNKLQELNTIVIANDNYTLIRLFIYTSTLFCLQEKDEIMEEDVFSDSANPVIMNNVLYGILYVNNQETDDIISIKIYNYIEEIKQAIKDK